MIRPTEARVSLGAIARNTHRLRDLLGPRPGIIAVVKADAYGHGAVRVARLLEGLGVYGFGVATVEEGVELRQAGVRAPVLVMGAAYGQDHEEVIAQNLTPMVGVASDVEQFARAARRRRVLRQPIHMKVDTGMSRLGVTADRFEDFLRACAEHPTVRVDGMATHFACADLPDPEPTLAQLALFIRCLDQARAMGADPQQIHAANSAATLRFPRTRFDLVRPGLLLYGALPAPHFEDPGLEPCMSWRTRINALRRIPAGAKVSYGGTWTAPRPSVIATLPVGYADGYSRAMSNRASVLVRGARAPQVGNICMDLCMVDVTDLPGVSVGDEVLLMGRQGEARITPEDLAAWAGTIPWEILCGITRRVPRVYDELELDPAAAEGETR